MSVGVDCMHTAMQALGTTPLRLAPTKACGYVEILSSWIRFLLTASLSLSSLKSNARCSHTHVQKSLCVQQMSWL